MKAARFYGNRDIRVEEVEVPQIRDGQVLVEIEWCGICGSDLHEYLVGKPTNGGIVTQKTTTDNGEQVLESFRLKTNPILQQGHICQLPWAMSSVAG